MIIKTATNKPQQTVTELTMEVWLEERGDHVVLRARVDVPDAAAYNILSLHQKGMVRHGSVGRELGFLLDADGCVDIEDEES